MGYAELARITATSLDRAVGRALTEINAEDAPIPEPAPADCVDEVLVWKWNNQASTADHLVAIEDELRRRGYQTRHANGRCNRKLSS